MALQRWLKRTDSKNQTDTDWAICLLRWGLVVCSLAVSYFDPVHRLPAPLLIPFLLAYAGYNLTITVLLTFNLLVSTIPVFTLVVDTATIAVLGYFSGGATSPFSFLYLFPILVATLRFGWRLGAGVTAVLTATIALHDMKTLSPASGPSLLFPTVLQMLLFGLAVVAAALVGRRAAKEPEIDPDSEAFLRPAVPDRVRTIYEMASTLSATLNYERVLEAMLDVSRLGFDELGQRMGESAGLVLLYAKDGTLFPAAHRNLVVPGDENRRIKGTSGIVGQAISSAQAMIGAAPTSDPELKMFHSLERFRSMICVPLRAGFETYGAVVFASLQPHIYTNEHKDLLLIFCNQATIALQNASLYQSLRQERDKIIDKEEQARHKLARDLHDGPTQDVAAIAMRLNFARLLIERDPARARLELARLEDLAHRTVREIRSMLFTLRPIVLETDGLIAALNQYADNLRDHDNLRVEIDGEHFHDCLNAETQGVVFAIIEEAVNNARKHAEATRIWVSLAAEQEVFVARIVDNGRGFDVEQTTRNYSSRGSLGLINLRERAELIGGTLKIESEFGRGTRITLVVPLEKQPD
jgi:signal transduction histidine kinase